MTSGAPPGRPPEAERDQAESAFTPILRAAWTAIPHALAVAFVDVEGECIDYVSSIDPFEAKVCGAHALVLLDLLSSSRKKLASGLPVLVEVVGSERELWARRITEDYTLVAVLLPGCDRAQVRSLLLHAINDFRREVGLATPRWEPVRSPLEVTVRKAVGWPYAPSAYSEGGTTVGITDVIGRWTEPGGIGGDVLVCFRVRTEDGQELTLVHDPDAEGWDVRL